MITHKAIGSKAVLRKHVLGAHPIIQAYIKKLNIAEIIDSHIEQDSRIKLRCGKIITLLIHNILTQPRALYEIRDWLAPLDERMLDMEKSECDLIYDDRVGGALENFYNGNHKEVFFRLALRAIKLFRLNCSQIHQDTTSVTVTGRYQKWSLEERLCHGHNKDHRPDLKQLILGTTVTADGAIPILHNVYSGNKTDDQVHVKNHRQLRKILERNDFIYVADCKLATATNLQEITACGGRFVSVMPRTWKEDSWFRERVRNGDVIWKSILSRPNNRKPDSKIDRYYLAKGEYRTSQNYVLYWIKSSQKAESDKTTRTSIIKKTVTQLKELQARLNRYKLKTRDAIELACQKIIAKNGTKEWISITIESCQSYTIKHHGRGRPAQNQKGEKVLEEYFTLAFDINKEAVNRSMLTDGVFPLITNVTEKSPKEILEIYKYQPFLEKRHTQYKTYQELNCVFLKKPERVVGIIHVHVLALMVATLIERQLRQAMQKEGIRDIPIYPEGNPCRYPTMYDLARLFNGVDKNILEDKEKITVFPPELTKVQEQTLKLLEIPKSLYC